MQRRPNVVVFFTDQQRWDTCGVHGNPLELTPNYDRFARSGTHAKLAFTCQPLCTPARSCLQTGRYATSTGCFRNGIPLAPDARTLAHVFNEGGYHTGYIGKWHLAVGARGPVEKSARGGYQYWLGANALEMVSDSYNCTVYDTENVERRLPGYRVDALTDAAIRYLNDRAQSPQPFFLFLSFLEPHHQNHRDDYPAPSGYSERYAGRWSPPDLTALTGNAPQHLGGYFGMVKRLDEAFGRTLDALQSLGLSEDTIVAFTSDHGCHFKTRNSEYKRSGHEASIRVPLALNGPGFRGGGEVQELVSLVDLPPTLIEAAGLTPPSTTEGRSLLPLLHGKSADWPKERLIQVSESELSRFIRSKRWKYGVTARNADPIRDSWAESFEETHLYDLLADPHELENLVGLESHRELSDRLRLRLLRAMESANEKLPAIQAAPSRPSGQRRVLPSEFDL